MQAGKQARPSAVVGADMEQVGVNKGVAGSRMRVVEEARFGKKEWTSCWKGCNCFGNHAFG